MKRFAFMACHAPGWPVRAQCRLLAVSPSGYYAWRKRAPAPTAEQALPAWQVAAQRVFTTLPAVTVSADYGLSCAAKAIK